jgi:hypothetical protein
MPMNPEVKAAWVAALRGGEYEQGVGYLCQESPADPSVREFCCLGVLCDLAAKAGATSGWIQPVIIPAPPTEYERRSFGVLREPPLGDVVGVEYAALPASVRNWAGLVDRQPEVIDPLWNTDPDCGASEWVDIIELNDDRGCSFEELAELIEQSL